MSDSAAAFRLGVDVLDHTKNPGMHVWPAQPIFPTPVTRLSRSILPFFVGQALLGWFMRYTVGAPKEHGSLTPCLVKRPPPRAPYRCYFSDLQYLSVSIGPLVLPNTVHHRFSFCLALAVSTCLPYRALSDRAQHMGGKSRSSKALRKENPIPSGLHHTRAYGGDLEA